MKNHHSTKNANAKMMRDFAHESDEGLPPIQKRNYMIFSSILNKVLIPSHNITNQSNEKLSIGHSIQEGESDKNNQGKNKKGQVMNKQSL